MTLAARVRYIDTCLQHHVHEGLPARPPQTMQLTIQLHLDGGVLETGVHASAEVCGF